MSRTSFEDGHLTISSPQPLMRRSKSMANHLNGAAHDGSRPTSMASAKTQSSSSGVSIIQSILKTLNTPMTSAGPPPRSQLSKSNRSSVSSTRSRRSRNKQLVGDGLAPPVPRIRPTSSLRDTTMSLLSDYSAFRNSIMSVSSSGMASEEIVAAAKSYYTSMKTYLSLIDDLPSSVRDTLDVKRLRQQLEFTVDLLQLVMQDSQSEQTILILDNTLMLVRTILSDVQHLLRQQANPATEVINEEEHEEDDDSTSVEVEYEYDIPEAHLAILVDAPLEDGPKQEAKGLRCMRSSMAIVNRFSKEESSDGSEVSSQEEPVHEENHIRRPLLAEHPNQTQETLVDFAHNIEAVADSLAAFKAYPLFAEASSTDVTVKKPDDTVDVTYSQDGTPVAMSAAAIIEELVKELSSQASGVQAVSGNFTDTILTTFRFFWDSSEFLRHLIEAYDNSYYIDRKLSIVTIVRYWVLAYWTPLDTADQNLEAIETMGQFLSTVLEDRIASATVIQDVIMRLKQYIEDPSLSAITHEVHELQYETQPWRFIDVSRGMPLYRGKFESVRLMEFNDKESCGEFSRQITLKESALYLQLSATEVIGCYVNKEKQDERAQEKMKALREFSSTVMSWAAFNVLKRSTPLKRAKMFGFMMRLAKACLDIRNFSAAHSIYNGLLSIHLEHLTQTKAEIMLKTQRNLDLVTNFFNENKDISMQSSALPTVPIMATYAGKLSRLKEAKGITTQSKVDASVQLVNISFFKAATRITYAMESNQHPYEYKAHAPLQAFIDHSLRLVPSEDAIYKLYLSVKAEEQNGSHPARPGMLSRLRTNSNALAKF